MGFLDGALGHASEIEPKQIQDEISKILVDGEIVEHAYQLIRDFFVFTNRRFIIVDKQGVTGSKTEFHSIPYKNIIHFSIETAGTLDLDAELKIWLSGMPTPIQKQFNRRLNIYKVQTVLANYVLGQTSNIQSEILSNPNETQILSEEAANNSVDEELDFCFHCGEQLDAKISKCKKCGGSLS